VTACVSGIGKRDWFTIELGRCFLKVTIYQAQKWPVLSGWAIPILQPFYEMPFVA